MNTTHLSEGPGPAASWCVPVLKFPTTLELESWFRGVRRRYGNSMEALFRLSTEAWEPLYRGIQLAPSDVRVWPDERGGRSRWRVHMDVTSSGVGDPPSEVVVGKTLGQTLHRLQDVQASRRWLFEHRRTPHRIGLDEAQAAWAAVCIPGVEWTPRSGLLLCAVDHIAWRLRLVAATVQGHSPRSREDSIVLALEIYNGLVRPRMHLEFCERHAVLVSAIERANLLPGVRVVAGGAR